MEIKKTIIFSALLFFLFYPQVSAGQNADSWYIKNFESRISVNKDSSLLIEEKITADCGACIDKHGIFRTLPLQTRTPAGTIKNPISLVSITDFDGNPLRYKTSVNYFNKTITWKIGDPNVNVYGENFYKITYLAKNAVRFQNPSFDELYWNLNGNYWDITTDKFSAELIFPGEVNQRNSQVYYYTGFYGQTGQDAATYRWLSDSVLEFSSSRTLSPREGITVSITFPKGIFAPYQPSFWERCGNFLWFLFPVAAFIICFRVWKKYGKDPKIDKTIIAEFEPPENMPPMEAGMLLKNGTFDNSLISSAIINFAVKGIISIREKEEKVLIFSSKDYIFTKLKEERAIPELTKIEKLLLEKIFSGGGTGTLVSLSELKESFFVHLPEIRKTAREELIEKQLMAGKGFSLQGVFLAPAVLIFILSFFLLVTVSPYALNLTAAGIIIFVFGLLMPQRTQRGTEILRKILGFKLYMETAEKYRQQFYEKENIFEKFLPYAMVFGITKLWMEKMKTIYGEKYFDTYHPVWFVGAGIGKFDFDSFNSHLNSISSAVGQSMGGVSGAGGGGFSGGGGGGGGGGGW